MKERSGYDWRAIVYALLFCATAAHLSLAQDPDTTGFPPFVTMLNASGYESINLSNLGIHFAIPIRTKSGRIPVSCRLSADQLYYPGGRGF